ncbi:hypothetical protein PHYC_01940 [Phycisphaerales bacterium]|nr:hypothetical protein PHYC_01940 [Phycisphaerales bacterium]
MLGIILLVLLVLLLIGSLPVYSYSRSWGYRGVSTVGVILIVLLVLLFLGYI